MSLHDLQPHEIADLAQRQSANNFGVESDALTALHLIVALANRLSEIAAAQEKSE